jgi:RNA polymerase-binding transcription factor DksA
MALIAISHERDTMGGMNIHAYKIKLEAEKKLLETELGGLGQVNENGDWEATPETQTAPEADPSDMSDRTEGYEERTATIAALEPRLKDINDALAKIEDGTYGICEVCGKPIEEDRLEANPAARTCKACMQ